MVKTANGSAEHILPLYMNGLSGRMLKLPAPANRRREILLVTGHHTSIERVTGLAEYLNRYGGVTSPDLPGFGGMESLYKIGEKPDIATLADYMASFIKFRYRDRRFSIIAVSYGFVVITNMLQRYPEIATKVDLLVSLSGFVHRDDFRWKPANRWLIYLPAKLTSQRFSSMIAEKLILKGPFIRLCYKIADTKHPKLKDADPQEREERMKYEIDLWKKNDHRTHAATSVDILRLDLTNAHVKLPVYHVAVSNDHYFNQVRVEQHMRAIYSDFELIKTKVPAHAPTVVASAKDVEPYVPPRVRSLLRKKV